MKRRSRTTRPKTFVGSSAESVDVAYAIQDNLQHDAQLTVWPQGVFELSRTALDSLGRALAASDFGIFVFAPNDVVQLRKKTYAAVRDNVVFELGLFVGRLGVERTFIIVPSNVKNLRIPTDLTGVTPGRYDTERDDGNLHAALGPVCNQIRGVMKKLKTVRRPMMKRPATRSGLGPVVIQKAVYGGGNRWVDVRPALRRKLRRGKWRILAGNQLGGDPAPGAQKRLRLNFSYGGRRYRASVPAGRAFSLPR